MKKEGTEVTLGARLATRYVPKQILSSAQSWGPLIGVEEVCCLEGRFAERSLTQDGDPAVTKEWLVHFIMEILDEKTKAFASSETQEDVLTCEVQLLNEGQLQVYRDEVTQWVSSFAVRVGVHDPLWDACDASNLELAMLKGVSIENSNGGSIFGRSSVAGFTESEIRVRKSRGGVHRSLFRHIHSGSSYSSSTHRRERCSRELVRWSDLTTNFVCDYEHFHRFDEEELTFTQVRGKLPTSKRSSSEKTMLGGIWRDSKRDVENVEVYGPVGDELHLVSADIILVAPLMGYIITSSKDGIVKMWDINSGLFRRNLYNAGSSWVIGMFLILDEEYILIAATNNHLTVLNFPEGNVVQKYVGCSSLLTSSSMVMQPSALHVQRYGMKPGECGAYRVTLHKGEQAEHYHRRRHAAQSDASSKNLPARPVVGFLNPTSCWFEPNSGIIFFGTADGKVGAFDISADVRPCALLAGANSKSLRLLFSIDVHRGAVVGIFYTSYASSLFTAGTDGCLYRILLTPNSELTGELRLVGHQSKPIRLMQWTPPSKYFITVHVNRCILIWVIGRYGDPLYSFPPETQEVVSAALHPRLHRIAVLLMDKTIKVYETHSSRSIATIMQPVLSSKFTGNDVLHQMMERSLSDEDGAVAWHPYHSCLISGLRALVIYEPSRGHHHSDVSSEGMSASPPEAEHIATISSDVEEFGLENGKPGRSLRSIPCLTNPKRTDSHHSGIVAITVYRQSCCLYTFDESSWRVWSLETGTLEQHVDVPHAARMANIPLKHATVASCSWTTSAQTRLATGSQDGSLLTWDPTTGAPLALEELVQDVSEQLDSDLSLMTHRNMLIAWCARTCRISTYNTGCVLPNGLEESKSVVVRVPSLASITACCVLRDVYLCMGTADARIYFFSIRGGAPIYDCSLRENNNDEKGSVVNLVFLNEQNQNVLIAILDIGILCVYSYVKQAMLYRSRLLRRLESRIRKVIYIPEDGAIAYGDSMGYVRVIDVRGCTSTTSDFRQALVPRISFCGATDEITSLEFFTASRRRYLLVGSLDRCVHLFQLDGSDSVNSDDGGETNDGTTWSRPSSPLLLLQRVSPVSRVVFVGTFGTHVWNLGDPKTFSRSPPRAKLVSITSVSEEALLESIVCSETRQDGVKSPIDTLIDDDTIVPCIRSLKSTMTASIAGETSPRAVHVAHPFFLTDPQHTQEEFHHSLSTLHLSSIRGKQHECSPPNQSLQAHALIHLSLPSTATQLHSSNQDQRLPTPSLPEACNPIGRLGDPALSLNVGNTPSLSYGELFSMRDIVSHEKDGVERSVLFSGVDGVEGNLLSDTNGLPLSSTDVMEQQKTKMILLGMAHRLEAVHAKGHLKGEFLRKSKELLLKDGDALPKCSKSSRNSRGGDVVKQNPEASSPLAERMEKYKREQIHRRQKKKSSFPLVSAKHHLTPVVIPQPSIIPTDVRVGNEWMLELPVTKVTESASAMPMRSEKSM